MILQSDSIQQFAALLSPPIPSSSLDPWFYHDLFRTLIHMPTHPLPQHLDDLVESGEI